MAGPRILLQDLIDRFQLSQKLLDQELSDEHLTKASKIIADHEILGPRLGLTEQEMIAIERDARTHELKKEAMLRKWKQKFSWRATYCMIIEALLECNRADHAREVCELLAQSKFF